MDLILDATSCYHAWLVLMHVHGHVAVSVPYGFFYKTNQSKHEMPIQRCLNADAVLEMLAISETLTQSCVNFSPDSMMDGFCV